MLVQSSFLFHSAPDSLSFVGRRPSLLYCAAIGFPEVNELLFDRVNDPIEGKIVVPAICPAAGFLIDVSPVENYRIVSHRKFTANVSPIAAICMISGRSPFVNCKSGDS